VAVDDGRVTWIVDIDGTLALRRQGQGERGPFDWHRVGEDLPNFPVILLVRALYAVGEDMLLTSGRLDVCRRQTSLWLGTHVHPGALGWPLFMRDTARQYMKDDQLKREIYEQQIRGKYGPITGVIDDRDRVVTMWRSLGLTCVQVADGDF